MIKSDFVKKHKIESKIKQWTQEQEEKENARNILNKEKRKLGAEIGNLNTKIGLYKRKLKKS